MRELAADWSDVTYPIFPKMVHWPGQPAVRTEVLGDIHCGDEARVSILHFSAHTGTHLDAPNHFLGEGIDISRAPLAQLMGPVRLCRVTGPGQIEPADITAYEARTRPLEAGERLLFRTRNSDRNWPQDESFDRDYAAISPAAADILSQRAIGFVGVDYLSVGPFATTADTHRTLLGAGIWIVEGVDLRKQKEGDYEMICLPLPVAGSDASPVRMLLRPALSHTEK